jgi:hypothetical protein
LFYRKSLKNTLKNQFCWRPGAGGLLESLPSKCETLSLHPSAEKAINKKKVHFAGNSDIFISQFLLLGVRELLELHFFFHLKEVKCCLLSITARHRLGKPPS